MINFTVKRGVIRMRDTKRHAEEGKEKGQQKPAEHQKQGQQKQAQQKSAHKK